MLLGCAPGYASAVEFYTEQGHHLNDFSLSWDQEMYHQSTQPGKSIVIDDYHPTVGAWDKMCNAFNTRDGICDASGGLISFRKDTDYQRTDLKGIIFNETQIYCKSLRGEACTLTIRLLDGDKQFISMHDHTRIHAKNFFLVAPNASLEIDDTSFIEVNGRSTNTLGTYNGQGAFFIGQGGRCTDNY